MLDRLLLRFIERRLARFRRPGDAADRFADRLIRLLSAEVERRDEWHRGWNRVEIVARAVEARHQTRAAIVAKFKSSESGSGLRLQ